MACGLLAAQSGFFRVCALQSLWGDGEVGGFGQVDCAFALDAVDGEGAVDWAIDWNHGLVFVGCLAELVDDGPRTR